MIDSYSIDPELEARLYDLGPVLSVPTGDALMDVVLDRVEQIDHDRPGRVRRHRRLVVALVAAAVALLALLAYPPTRTAIADRLGIGAVRFTVDQSNPSSPPGPATPGPVATTPTQQALAEAQAEVSFPIRLPDPALAGAPVHVETEPDPPVPGGLVSVAFERFTLTEVAAQPDQQAVVNKDLGSDTRLELLTVNGRDGAWIAGAPHAWAYLDPAGAVRTETIRRAGNVLLWEQGGVTFRIEGLESKADALQMAASLR